MCRENSYNLLKHWCVSATESITYWTALRETSVQKIIHVWRILVAVFSTEFSTLHRSIDTRKDVREYWGNIWAEWDASDKLAFAFSLLTCSLTLFSLLSCFSCSSDKLAFAFSLLTCSLILFPCWAASVAPETFGLCLFPPHLLFDTLSLLSCFSCFSDNLAFAFSLLICLSALFFLLS